VFSRRLKSQVAKASQKVRVTARSPVREIDEA